jgi:hypothetical protein
VRCGIWGRVLFAITYADTSVFLPELVICRTGVCTCENLPPIDFCILHPYERLLWLQGAQFKVASVASPLLRHFASGVHPTAIHGRRNDRDAQIQKYKQPFISLHGFVDLSLLLVSVSLPAKWLCPVGTMAVLT